MPQELSGHLKEKYEKLIALIKSLQSAVVAYSGGTDSTLLAVICKNTLGDKAISITAQSETYPSSELKESIELAQKFNLNHMVIHTSELSIESFSDNPANRCYYCKKELFKKLREIADKKSIAYVLDGTTQSDASDYRPGRKAAIELGVKSPLLEAGLDKEEVRVISQYLGLPTWNKPAYACLASRIPYGTKITQGKLNTIEEAEEFLKTLGFKVLRVRYHEEIARIELAPQEMDKALEPNIKDRIIRKFRSLGFLYITIDLEGYRSGSMNMKLEKQNGGTMVMDAPELEAPAYMNCPRCDSRKLENRVIRDTKFKQCPDCGGIWFELNELERAFGDNIRFGIPDKAKSKNYVSQAFKAACPVCQAQLVHIKAIDMPELSVEACLICQGRWVDGAEVKKFQQRGFLTKIKNFVLSLF